MLTCIICIYIILMLALAAFLHRESKRLLAGESRLLRELCQSPLAAKAALSAMRIVFLAACASAALMLLCLLLTLFGSEISKPLAAASILCYSAGFILAVWKLSRI